MARAKKIVEDVVEEIVPQIEENEVEVIVDDVEVVEAAPESPTVVEDVVATIDVEETPTPFLNYGNFTVEEVVNLINHKKNNTLDGVQAKRWNSLMDETYRAYGTMRQMVATASECPSSAVSIDKVLFRYENEPNNAVLFSSILKVHNLEQVKLVIAVLQTRTL